MQEADRLGAHGLRQYLRVGVTQVALLPYSVLVALRCTAWVLASSPAPQLVPYISVETTYFFFHLFKSARKSEALATGRETKSKLLCTVLEKTILLKDIQTEMSQSWALIYCE